MVGIIICEVGTIMCDIGTINVRFYLLEVRYPHGYYRITRILFGIRCMSFDVIFCNIKYYPK